MITMFAFIVSLGIVVDDAIVCGENIYEYRERGMGPIESAIAGARDIAMPITFSILTNIVAFLPLYVIPGFMGKIWGVVPLVVCTVFIISLVEAAYILPSHLAHTKSGGNTAVGRWVHDRQQAFSRAFRRGVDRFYKPSLDLALRYRGLTVAIGFAGLALVYAFVASGRIGIILMPRVESDQAVVTAILPVGSPMEEARRIQSLLLEAGDAIVESHGGEALSRGAYGSIEENEVRVDFFLLGPEERPISTTEFTRQWRERVGNIAGVESLRFQSDRGGPGSGAALTVELSHRDIPTLERASAALAERLADFAAIKEIDDGFASGKAQLDFRVTPTGSSLGFASDTLGTQLRNAFQGGRALRQQRGRNEITVRVRLPEPERTGLYDLERLVVQAPRGGEVPLAEVAVAEAGRAFTSIQRRDGRRTMLVTGDVDPIGESARVRAAVEETVLPQLRKDFPGLSAGFEGRQAEFAESFDALIKGLLMALLVIYVLLAIPFRSYIQPMIVMAAIPFGIVGAVLGHLLMGYNLSIISIMGVVALCGVVINDSLVLVEYTNKLVREDGLSPKEAIREAAVRRFRPIVLTTMTTFGGLAPMIFETSRQARFMIPMAISLGFGILFATVIVLVLIPAFYLLLDDLHRAWRWMAPVDRAPAHPAE
jgi:multidrug efflux pump subunit AcrB